MTGKPWKLYSIYYKHIPLTGDVFYYWEYGDSPFKKKGDKWIYVYRYIPLSCLAEAMQLSADMEELDLKLNKLLRMCP